MGYLSFDEKAWGKVRPSSVKKTGVSEALNAFEKVVPNKLDVLTTSSKCKIAADLLDTVADKLEGALKQMDKKKDDEAIKTVGRWQSEVRTGLKAIADHTVKVEKAQTLQIEAANALLDPFFKELKAQKADILGFLTTLQECAKEAVLAVAKGELDGLPELESQAQDLVREYTKRAALVQGIPKVALASLARKLPDANDLNAAQRISRLDVIHRREALDSEAREVGYQKEDFVEALGRVMTAKKQAGSLEEKFVKIVEMDVQICKDFARPIGANELAIMEELKLVATGLDKLEDVNTTEEEKAKLLRVVALKVKSELDRMKTLVADVDALEKVVVKKTSNYPDFVVEENQNFKRPVQEIAALHRYIDDLKKKTLTGANMKLRNAVERLKKLTTK